MTSYNARCEYGVFEKWVRVTCTGRLSHQPYAQAGYIEYDNGNVALVSYESLIFELDLKNKEVIFDNSQAAPNYSRTTAKHVGSFCKQFAPELTYHDIKHMYNVWCDMVESEVVEYYNGWKMVKR